MQKVWTPNGGTTATTYYVYDAQGNVAAEYTDQTLPAAATSYAFSDMLGSVRAVTICKPHSPLAVLKVIFPGFRFRSRLSTKIDVI